MSYADVIRSQNSFPSTEEPHKKFGGLVGVYDGRVGELEHIEQTKGSPVSDIKLPSAEDTSTQAPWYHRKQFSPWWSHIIINLPSVGC